MYIDTIATVYQLPRIEDEPADADAIEPELNNDLKIMAQKRKEISMRYMRDQERNTCRNYLNCTHRLKGRI